MKANEMKERFNELDAICRESSESLAKYAHKVRRGEITKEEKDTLCAPLREKHDKALDEIAKLNAKRIEQNFKANAIKLNAVYTTFIKAYGFILDILEANMGKMLNKRITDKITEKLNAEFTYQNYSGKSYPLLVFSVKNDIILSLYYCDRAFKQYGHDFEFNIWSYVSYDTSEVSYPIKTTLLEYRIDGGLIEAIKAEVERIKVREKENAETCANLHDHIATINKINALYKQINELKKGVPYMVQEYYKIQTW